MSKFITIHDASTGRAGKPYRPSNGTEGDIFDAHVCGDCNKYENAAGESCPHRVAMHLFNVDEDVYPDCIIHDEKGNPGCCDWVPFVRDASGMMPIKYFIASREKQEGSGENVLKIFEREGLAFKICSGSEFIIVAVNDKTVTDVRTGYSIVSACGRESRNDVIDNIKSRASWSQIKKAMKDIPALDANKIILGYDWSKCTVNFGESNV